MAAVQGGNKEVVEVLLNLETKHLCDTNVQDEVRTCTLLIETCITIGGGEGGGNID